MKKMIMIERIKKDYLIMINSFTLKLKKISQINDFLKKK